MSTKAQVERLGLFCCSPAGVLPSEFATQMLFSMMFAYRQRYRYISNRSYSRMYDGSWCYRALCGK